MQKSNAKVHRRSCSSTGAKVHAQTEGIWRYTATTYLPYKMAAATIVDRMPVSVGNNSNSERENAFQNVWKNIILLRYKRFKAYFQSKLTWVQDDIINQLMYKTAVYTLVNGAITHQKPQI